MLKKKTRLNERVIDKKLSGRKREHVQVLYSHAHAGECLGQRKTHTHKVKQRDLCTFSQEVRSSKNAGRELTPENPHWRFRTWSVEHGSRVFFFSFLDFISKSSKYIFSEHCAQAPCILTSVKFVPSHAEWVGASTEANTVGCAACLQTFPAEQEWQSGGLPTILTAAEWGREGGPKAKERETREKSSHFNTAFDVGLYLSSRWTLTFWDFSNTHLGNY